MEIFHRTRIAAHEAYRVLNRLRRRDRFFLALEFCICLPLLILFTIAYPDLYRSRLWENGGANGWNSDPKLRIYFYANHKEPPEIPFIWTQSLTESNLAIAILSFVVFAARLVLLPLGYLPLWIEALYDFLLTGLWAASATGQSSGDYSDPDHVSSHPWYLTRSCSASWTSERGGCRMAQASFVLALLAILLYSCRTASHALDTLRARLLRGGEEDPRRGCGPEGGFSDTETLPSSACPDECRIYKDALSPVLAFFPEDNAKGSWG